MIKDIIDQNATVSPNKMEIAILHRYFPCCFTNEGKFDLDLFYEKIKKSTDTTKEGFALNYLGKEYARLIASLETTTVIVPDEVHNSKTENINSENVYISGDNLDALSHLLKSYTKQIKCIYIDPPYNTGSDGFAYNDKFSFTKEDLVTKLSISEEQATKILDLTKRGSASHSAWLMFMSPRLQLARELLREDGAIFISIDDNEEATLKLLCDSIFGEENFIAKLTIVTGANQAGEGVLIQKNVEYCICYARNKELVTINRVDKTSDDWRNLNDAPTPFLSRPELGYTIYYNEHTGDMIPKMDYDKDKIETNDPNEVYTDDTELIKKGYVPVRPGFRNGVLHRWRWEKDTFIERQSEIKIFVTEDGYTPRFKQEGFNPPKNIHSFAGGTPDLKKIFGERVPFEFSKGVSFCKYIVSIGSGDNDIVLDFFSGSATTAQAVMQLNAEQEGSSRKFIMVQLQEACKPKSIARQLGYTTIDEIGQKRIELASQKIKTDTNATIDYGFKHYTIQDVSQNSLDKMEVFNPNGLADDLNIKDCFGLPTILTTWLLRDGYGFNASAEAIKLDSYIVYSCGQHMYMINEGLTESDIIELVDLFNRVPSAIPSTVVLFGYSFVYHNLELVKKNLRSLKIGEDTRKLNIDVRY